ncbi:calmodulin-like protein 3 [Punica granatum]|uniref:EF-hand domain-containing protein n=2 Tax=Punica granatum TaxID=22663 RepID=A0A218VZC5_PUNGR|nr:calmodulin-like protein 3 [Punica granatum]OWM65937.1 hypothetical protein CDL15_Pgr015362 [Punica granatum]PKI79597.1 hypothetical protein CRG98_000072 [Punica granatum]
MVSVAIILVSLLFLASLLNIILNYPTKKLLPWFQSLINIARVPSSNAPSIASSSSTRKPSAPSEEKSAHVVKKESKSTRESNDDKGFDEQRKMLFSTFDRDGDGFITRKELRDSLRGIRIFMSEEEIDEIVAKSDSNGDGLIDFGEFCKLLEDSSMGFGSSSNQEEGEVEGGLKEAFDVFDKDKDGLISVEELGSVMCSLGLLSDGGKKVEDCKEMIRKVDMDGDGMVNFDEFKRMMMPGGGAKPLIVAH